MSARAVCAFAALTLLHGTLAAAQPIVRLARDGRTIAVPQPLDENQPIRFRIEGNVTQPGCLSRRPEAGALQIRYDFVENLEPPGVLPWSGPVATPDGEFLVVPAPPGQTRFLVFNVWERSIPIATAAERERLMTCVRSRRTVEAGLGQARQQVTAAETVLRDRTTIVENRLTAVKRLLESIAAFQHVDGDGVDRVLLLQQRLVAARALLATAERDRETAVRDLEGRTATLRTLEGNLGTNADDFISATNRLSDYLGFTHSSDTYFEAMVVKAGGLLVRKTDKAVYYDLLNRAPTDVVAVSVMGEMPVARYGDHLFAALTNVVLGAFPQPFAIRVTAHAGSVINTAPSRPVFEPGAVGAEAAAPTRPPKVFPAPIVYRDVFLPVSGTFAPNDYAEVTIVTEANNAEGKPQEVKIVDKAKFPQFRALYRYNFNTGVIRSRLRNPSFTKVKIADDDPTTDKVNEARYRVDEDPGHTQILPIFGFTFYPVPVDVQGPVMHERWIPAPTVGFGFTNPAKEIFLGFSHEVIRNTQFVWGWHFGEVTELLSRNVVSEDHDATAPLTQKGRDHGFSVGLSFNINIVTKIFK